MRERLLALIGIFAALFLGPGCTKSNPEYCDAMRPCADPARPFCDLTGAYQPLSNFCIAQPGAQSNPNLPPVDMKDAFLQVSRGSDHACAIRGDGTLRCWGAAHGQRAAQSGIRQELRYTNGTYERVGTDSDWEIISGDDGVNCGIRKGGSLWCWGDNACGSVGAVSRAQMEKYCTPYAHPPETPVITEPTELVPGTRWKRVVAGSLLSCGIKEDGSWWCWGPGTRDTQIVPRRIGMETRWDLLHVEPGYLGGTMCAAKQGEVYCFGRVVAGEEGSERFDNIETPRKIDGPTNVVELGGAWGTTCARQADGAVWCWGLNEAGQMGLGAPSGQNIILPRRVATNTSGMAFGFLQMCLLSNGEIRCAGQFPNGELGATVTNASFTRLGQDADWSALWSCGDGYCGRKGTAPQPLYWGSNLLAQVSGKSFRTSRLEGAWRWISADPGGRYMCGVRIDNSLWCWGENSSGELGLGLPRYASRAAAQQVLPGTEWSAVFTASSYACGIRTTGTLTCWGAIPNMNESPTPDIQPKSYGLSPQNLAWITLGLGSNHACGLDIGGHLFCWGHNGNGQLGTGDRNAVTVPVPSGDGGDGWTFISALFNATCGVRGSRLFCWGRGESIGLGVGSADALAPAQRSTAMDWSRLWGKWGLRNGRRYLLSGDLTTPVDDVIWDWLVDANLNGDGMCGVSAEKKLICVGDQSARGLGSSTGAREVGGGGRAIGLALGTESGFAWYAEKGLQHFGFGLSGERSEYLVTPTPLPVAE